MGRKFDSLTIQYGGPYSPSLPPSGQRPRPCLIAGRNVWSRADEGGAYTEAWRGLASVGSAITAGLIVPLGGDTLPGGIGTGTILVYRSDSTWFIGTGTAKRFGPPALNAAASSALQFLLNSVVFTAGLSQPAAPALYLSAQAGKCRGTYSAKLTQGRSETGEESNASANFSNVVTANNNKLILSLDTIATVADGKRWGFYGSDGGYSQLGPWTLRQEFNSSQIGTNQDINLINRPNSILVDYADFEGFLGTTAPFQFSPPPHGSHLTTLGSVVVVLGTFGVNGEPPGSGVSPSTPGRLAWPATYTRFLNPAEPIVRVDGRPDQGWQTVFTRHSVQAILLSGDELGPVMVRPRWASAGIGNPNGAVVLEMGEIYAALGDGYFGRSIGGTSPDTSFTRKIRTDIKGVDPTTCVLGHYPAEDTVVFFDNATKLAYPFDRRTEEFHTPFDMSPYGSDGVIQALGSNTGTGKLYVVIGGQLMTFDTGSSGVNWRAVPVQEEADNPRKKKTIYSFSSVYRGAVTHKLLGNNDLSTALETTVGSGGGDQDGAQKKTVVKDLRRFTFEASGTAAGDRAYTTTVEGQIDDALVD